MNIAQNLNATQQKAMLHTEGPLLIVAGAGAGKTRVLTHRIAHLVESGVNPEQILAVTFTNKAAGEMRERVHALIKNIGFDSAPFSIHQKPFVSTFHALGVFMLRSHGQALGIKKNFSIKNKDGTSALLKEAIKNHGLDIKQYSSKYFNAIISRQKGELASIETYREEASDNYFSATISDVWETYEQLLKKENSLDFDDLISKTVLLLKNNKDILEHYQKKWRYIHIDEYQDTNHAQYTLSKLLSGTHQNICVVGDGDQNVYSWRGADVQNILRFEKDYPGAKTILLEENYRSTQTILNVANEIIRKNKLRKEKNLFTRKKVGERISLFPARDEEEEAYFIAGEARALIKKGISPESIAVLYRANFQSRVLEELFLALKVPHQIIGTRFFERKEVKDILSFIHASINTESLSDIRRIINVPPRGVGKATIAKLFAGKKNELSSNMKEKVDNFFLLLEKIERVCETEKPSEIIKFVMKKTGIEAHLKQEGEDGLERLENIKELATLASRYDTLPHEEGVQQFLNDAALAGDQDELKKEKRGVRLMTVHAAKGLEFPYVFIAGLEQGLFPHSASFASAEVDTEEERRLFYVALTRAQEKVYLSFAQQRMLFGSRNDSIPSEFLNDIPPELIEFTNEAERDVEKIEYL